MSLSEKSATFHALARSELRYELIRRLGHGLETRDTELVDGHEHSDIPRGRKRHIAKDALQTDTFPLMARQASQNNSVRYPE